MTSPIRRGALPALVALAALATATPAGADDLVADVARDTPISAYHGIVAWSDFDATAGRYRLVLRRGGLTVPAAMPGATRAFDVTLGPDARGREVAVYTRCRSGDHGCDVYRYDIAARRESRVAGVSSPSRDEAFPSQWRGRLAFVRRGRTFSKNAGSVVSCDVPFVKTLGSRAPARRLDRGRCAQTVGMSIHGERIVQTTTASEVESIVRLLGARGGPARRLLRDASGLNGESAFVSPSQSASAVWLTRTGNRSPLSFLRIDLPSGRLTEVDPHVGLAGRIARDDRGTFWYVQAPAPGYDYDPAPPFCRSPLEPCRLVRASASPFSATPRVLLAQMRSSAGPYGEARGPAGAPLPLSGDFTRPVVRRGRVVARQPLAGVPVDLLAGGGEAGLGPYAPTGLTTVTDAQGRWSFVLAQPPPSRFFAAFARGNGVASPATLVTTTPPA